MTVHWLQDPYSEGLPFSLSPSGQYPAGDVLLRTVTNAITATVQLFRQLDRRTIHFGKFLLHVQPYCPEGWDERQFLATVRALFHPSISWSLVETINPSETGEDWYTLRLPDGAELTLKENVFGQPLVHLP